MQQPIKLVRIPDAAYSDYRYEVIFGAYKWDPQVEDHNTVARHAVLISPQTAAQLDAWARQLSRETMELEEAFLHHLPLAKELGFPRPVSRALPRLAGYNRDKHVRLLRFDFHPTTDGGWAISEVNSDVPGGFAEASVLPSIAAKYFDGFQPHHNMADHMLKAFRAKSGPEANIAFVHCTSYSDDRQVMEFLSDHFRQNGMQTFFAAPDHITWKDKHAHSLLEGSQGPVDGIVRFFPLEWLANLPRRADWRGFYDCETPSCNHPVSIFAQSKRLPLVWDQLGVDIPGWKTLLPETRDPRQVPAGQDGWIFKPNLGRVGEGISIKEAITPKELAHIQKDVRRHPKEWLAQRRFDSLPLTTDQGETYHLCLGVFTVDGESAGFYGRISPYPRIDSKARDIPLLVAKEANAHV